VNGEGAVGVVYVVGVMGAVVVVRVRAVIVATQLAQVFVAQLVAAVTEFQLLEMRSPTHRSLGEQQLPGQQELQRHHHAHHQSCYRTYT